MRFLDKRNQRTSKLKCTLLITTTTTNDVTISHITHFWLTISHYVYSFIAVGMCPPLNYHSFSLVHTTTNCLWKSLIPQCRPWAFSSCTTGLHSCSLCPNRCSCRPLRGCSLGSWCNRTCHTCTCRPVDGGGVMCTRRAKRRRKRFCVISRM